MVDIGYNYLLDKLPKDYMGYPIRTNFSVGIKIIRLFDNSKLNDYQKYEVAIKMLFKKDAKVGFNVPIDVAIKGVIWFMQGGREVSTENDYTEVDDTDDEDDDNDNLYDDYVDDDDETTSRAYDFIIDSKEIYTAFRRTYGINLHKDYVHWFDFLALLSDLDECNFTRIVDIRTKSMKDLSKAEKKYYSKMKCKYALPPTSEEIALAKELYGNRVVGGHPVWKNQWLGCWFYDQLE